MKTTKNIPSLPTHDKLNAITPDHQDFNFEVWATAVREQMISVLANKGSMVEKTKPDK